MQYNEFSQLNKSQSDTEMRILWPAVRFKVNIRLEKNRAVYCNNDMRRDETKEPVGWSFS